MKLIDVNNDNKEEALISYPRCRQSTVTTLDPQNGGLPGSDMLILSDHLIRLDNERKREGAKKEKPPPHQNLQEGQKSFSLETSFQGTRWQPKSGRLLSPSYALFQGQSKAPLLNDRPIHYNTSPAYLRDRTFPAFVGRTWWRLPGNSVLNPSKLRGIDFTSWQTRRSRNFFSSIP